MNVLLSNCIESCSQLTLSARLKQLNQGTPHQLYQHLNNTTPTLLTLHLHSRTSPTSHIYLANLTNTSTTIITRLSTPHQSHQHFTNLTRLHQSYQHLISLINTSLILPSPVGECVCEGVGGSASLLLLGRTVINFQWSNSSGLTAFNS